MYAFPMYLLLCMVELSGCNRLCSLQALKYYNMALKKEACQPLHAGKVLFVILE